MDNFQETYESMYTSEQRAEFEKKFDKLAEKVLEGKLTENELKEAQLPFFMESELWAENMWQKADNEFRNYFSGKKVALVREKIPEELREDFKEEGILEGIAYGVLNAWRRPHDIVPDVYDELVNKYPLYWDSPTLEIDVNGTPKRVSRYVFDLIDK